MRTLRNALIFLYYAIKYNTPFTLWPQAWQEINAEHLAQVRKYVWELKKEGRIYEDRDGFLYPIDQDDTKKEN